MASKRAETLSPKMCESLLLGRGEQEKLSFVPQRAFPSPSLCPGHTASCQLLKFATPLPAFPPYVLSVSARKMLIDVYLLNVAPPQL